MIFSQCDFHGICLHSAITIIAEYGDALHSYFQQARYEELMSDSGYLDQVLGEGARNAADIADATLHNVYQAMGFSRRH